MRGFSRLRRRDRQIALAALTEGVRSATILSVLFFSPEYVMNGLREKERSVPFGTSETAVLSTDQGRERDIPGHLDQDVGLQERR